jgi:hypothetical protein
VDLKRRLDSDEGFEFFALAVVVGDVEVLACDVTDERMVVGTKRLRIDLLVEVAAVDGRPRDHRVLDRMFSRETDVDSRGLDGRHGAAVGGRGPPGLAHERGLRVRTEETLLGTVGLLTDLWRHDDDLSLSIRESIGCRHVRAQRIAESGTVVV